MGLLQAAGTALNTLLADQWREYFYCDAMSSDILMVKGEKRTRKGSSNTKGSDNIISNGSIIAVNEGQAMMIVDQGAVVEFSAQPGEFVWDSSTEPSIFVGNLKDSIKATWEIMKKRFTFGGDTGKDQRVYYVNVKEIIGNKYGTANPVPFRVVDKNVGLDMDIGIKCFGEYSFHIADPMLFYKHIGANVPDSYPRSRIDSQMKAELLNELQPAFAKISAQGVRYSAVPAHTTELADALNECLSEKWGKLRGIEIVSFGVASITANPEDEATIKELQKAASLSNPNVMYGHLAGAAASAMQGAASNEGGAMLGFAGLNMAQGATGMNLGSILQAAQANQQQQYAQAQAAAAAEGWTCPACGKAGNTGKFCSECGAKKPEERKGWKCPSCGAVNKGKCCSECGAKKPEGEPLYKCDKCGWEPEDPANPPKFCPECGDPFTDEDRK